MTLGKTSFENIEPLLDFDERLREQVEFEITINEAIDTFDYGYANREKKDVVDPASMFTSLYFNSRLKKFVHDGKTNYGMVAIDERGVNGEQVIIFDQVLVLDKKLGELESKIDSEKPNFHLALNGENTKLAIIDLCLGLKEGELSKEVFTSALRRTVVGYAQTAIKEEMIRSAALSKPKSRFHKTPKSTK